MRKVDWKFGDIWIRRCVHKLGDDPVDSLLAAGASRGESLQAMLLLGQNKRTRYWLSHCLRLHRRLPKECCLLLQVTINQNKFLAKNWILKINNIMIRIKHKLSDLAFTSENWRCNASLGLTGNCSVQGWSFAGYSSGRCDFQIHLRGRHDNQSNDIRKGIFSITKKKLFKLLICFKKIRNCWKRRIVWLRQWQPSTTTPKSYRGAVGWRPWRVRSWSIETSRACNPANPLVWASTCTRVCPKTSGTRIYCRPSITITRWISWTPLETTCQLV